MVRRLPPAFLLFLLVACSGDSSQRGRLEIGEGGAILPRVDTVDGVPVMRHGADALERAPRWTLDTVPLVVIDGGEEFDLSWVGTPVPLADGGWAVLKQIGGGELMLFDSAGKPARKLARRGNGPGELMSPLGLTVLPGDTIQVVDDANRSINWYTADSGLARTARLEATWPLYCYQPTGKLAAARHVAIGYCTSNVRTPDGGISDSTPLVVFPMDRSRVDTLRIIPSIEMRMVEIKQGSRSFMTPVNVELGRFPTVTAVDSTVVLAGGVGGYVIDLLSPTGRSTGRIVVDRPAVPVTPAIKQAAIDIQLERIDETPYESGADIERIKDGARNAPYADTLPPYRRVLPGADGVFWVLDYILPGDSTWTATAFRLDGAIHGRLTGPLGAGPRAIGPVWFGRDRVMLWQSDEDGVVRYGVYRVVKARPALAQGASGGGEG